jgi:TPR repeat protein
VLRQNADANVPRCNADDEGEDDRSLTVSDTKTRSLNRHSLSDRVAANTRKDIEPKKCLKVNRKLCARRASAKVTTKITTKITIYSRDRANLAPMTGRPSTAAIASCFGIGLATLAAGFAHSPANALSADLVLCDRIAADPSDPDKPADVKGAASIAPSDILTAIKFCRTASASSRRALYQLGRAYAANQQMPAAIASYRKAADKGSTAAMIALGSLYATGTGVPKDEDQARQLFERAASAGNPNGTTNLVALFGAAGSSSDPAQARALLSKAADANSAEAQFQLGVMMAEGAGGPHDDVAARALFEKAAAQNHAAALDWLGSFAASGRGGPQDKEAAKSYYERAAALGNEDAKVQLERLKCPMVFTTKKGEILTHLCF